MELTQQERDRIHESAYNDTITFDDIDKLSMDIMDRVTKLKIVLPIITG